MRSLDYSTQTLSRIKTSVSVLPYRTEHSVIHVTIKSSSSYQYSLSLEKLKHLEEPLAAAIHLNSRHTGSCRKGEFQKTPQQGEEERKGKPFLSPSTRVTQTMASILPTVPRVVFSIIEPISLYVSLVLSPSPSISGTLDPF